MSPSRTFYHSLYGESTYLVDVDKFLGPYSTKYRNVVITGPILPRAYASEIKSLADLKSSILYTGGRPRISSTPLGVNSLYNRHPIVITGPYSTSFI